MESKSTDLTEVLIHQAETRDCPYCMETYDISNMIKWADLGSVCDDMMCRSCALQEVRRQLDPQVSGKRIVCHNDHHALLSLTTLDEIRSLRLDGFRPLADEEYKRAKLWLMQAVSPTAHLIGCPMCSDPILLPIGSTDGTLVSFTCACGAQICASCEKQTTLAAVTHEGKTCAEFRAATESPVAATETVMPTEDFKRCPICGEGITHYRGHACHHMVPGRGCPTCASRGLSTHFCSVCLDPWPHTNRPPCPLYCSPACDCPDCPDCIGPDAMTGTPARPCSQCSGATSGCRVCAGINVRSATVIESWRHEQELARAELLSRGWCGPRRSRPATTTATPAAPQPPAINIYQTISTIARATTTNVELVVALHNLAVAVNASAHGRDTALAYGAISAIRSRMSATDRLVDQALCEGVLEYLEVAIEGAPTNAMGRFADGGGFMILYNIFNTHRESPNIVRRVLGVAASVARAGMMNGIDVPPEAEQMFDGVNGMSLVLNMQMIQHLYILH